MPVATEQTGYLRGGKRRGPNLSEKILIEFPQRKRLFASAVKVGGTTGGIGSATSGSPGAVSWSFCASVEVESEGFAAVSGSGSGREETEDAPKAGEEGSGGEGE